MVAGGSPLRNGRTTLHEEKKHYDEVTAWIAFVIFGLLIVGFIVYIR